MYLVCRTLSFFTLVINDEIELGYKKRKRSEIVSAILNFV